MSAAICAINLNPTTDFGHGDAARPNQGLNVDGSRDSTGLFGLSKSGGGVLLSVIILAAIGLVVAIVVGILMCRGGTDDKNGSKAADTSDEEAGTGVPMKPMGDSANDQEDLPTSNGAAGVELVGVATETDAAATDVEIADNGVAGTSVSVVDP